MPYDHIELRQCDTHAAADRIGGEAPGFYVINRGARCDRVSGKWVTTYCPFVIAGPFDTLAQVREVRSRLIEEWEQEDAAEEDEFHNSKVG